MTVHPPPPFHPEPPRRPRCAGGVALPSVEDVDALAPAELAAFASHLAALLARATLRLQTAARDTGDDVEAYDVEEAARRLSVSVDTLREYGEAWGVALVVTRDRQGRATRVVYPRGLLRTFLNAKRTTTMTKRPPA